MHAVLPRKNVICLPESLVDYLAIFAVASDHSGAWIPFRVCAILCATSQTGCCRDKPWAFRLHCAAGAELKG